VLYLLILAILHLPRPALFPYTTLFRSLVDPVVPAQVAGIVEGDGAPVHGSLQGQPSLGEELLDQLGVVDHLEETAQGAVLVLERSEEHTSELQSRENLVCRLLLEKKKE